MKILYEVAISFPELNSSFVLKLLFLHQNCPNVSILEVVAVHLAKCFQPVIVPGCTTLASA